VNKEEVGGRALWRCMTMVTYPKWHIVGREGEKVDRGGIFHHVTPPPNMGPTYDCGPMVGI